MRAAAGRLGACMLHPSRQAPTRHAPCRPCTRLQLEQRCDLTRTLDLPAPEDVDPPSLPPGLQR